MSSGSNNIIVVGMFWVLLSEKALAREANVSSDKAFDGAFQHPSDWESWIRKKSNELFVEMFKKIRKSFKLLEKWNLKRIKMFKKSNLILETKKEVKFEYFTKNEKF